MNFTVYAAILILLFSGQLAVGQSLPIVREALAGAENGKVTSVNYRAMSEANDLPETIDLLAGAINDSSQLVRTQTILILGVTGDFIEPGIQKQKVIELLTESINDPSSALAGRAIEFLTYYNAKEFSSRARQNILNSVRNGTSHYEILIRLAGFINADGTEELFDQLMASDSLSEKERSAIKFAKARNGDTQLEDGLYQGLSKVPVNDALMYNIVPQVMYVKSEKIARLLADIVLSDEKNCEPADMEVSGNIICGYVAMEYLAVMIENFPIPADRDGYLETDDYDQALQIIRDWLRTDPDFVIDKSEY